MRRQFNKYIGEASTRKNGAETRAILIALAGR